MSTCTSSVFVAKHIKLFLRDSSARVGLNTELVIRVVTVCLCAHAQTFMHTCSYTFPHSDTLLRTCICTNTHTQ